jgi:hypothetical protein
MQRAPGRGGAAAGGAAAASATAVVVELKKLKAAAEQAQTLMRRARTAELFGRALKVADAALPRDSLITASLLDSLAVACVFITAGASATHAEGNQLQDMVFAAWQSDTQAVTYSRRALQICVERWNASKLFKHSADEAAYFEGVSAQVLGARMFMSCANCAAVYWPPPVSAPELESRARAAHGALRAALELEARGAALDAHTVAVIKALLVVGLSGMAYDGLAHGGLLETLRLCGMSTAEEAALHQLRQRLSAPAVDAAVTRENDIARATVLHNAAADVARHGLRRCALPSCGDTEPHPKLFKLCGRCRGAAYCCAAHSVEDWKRHKKEDGCTAAN